MIFTFFLVACVIVSWKLYIFETIQRRILTAWHVVSALGRDVTCFDTLPSIESGGE